MEDLPIEITSLNPKVPVLRWLPNPAAVICPVYFVVA